MNIRNEGRKGRREGESMVQSNFLYLSESKKFFGISASSQKLFKCKVVHKKKLMTKMTKFTQSST